MNCPSTWKQLLLSLANSKSLHLDRWQPHNWFVAVFYFDLKHDYISNDWQVVISKCRELFNFNSISSLSADYYLHTVQIKVNMPKKLLWGTTTEISLTLWLYYNNRPTLDSIFKLPLWWDHQYLYLGIICWSHY